MNRRLAVALALALSACVEQPPSRTAADATEFGYESVSCPGRRSVSIYTLVDSLDRHSTCAAYDRAIRAAAEGGLVAPHALVTDSVLLAVVRPLRFGKLPSRPEFPDSGIEVTLELVNRPDNLSVSWPGLESQIDVGWVPKGLKY